MSEVCRADFEQYSVRELVYPGGRRMPRHAHGYSNLTVVVSGEIDETTDDGEHRGRSCSVLLKPAGTMHSNSIPGRQGTRTVSIELKPASPLAKQLRRWEWIETPDTARAALAFYAAFRSGVDVESTAMALLAIATANAALGMQQAPPWLEVVKRILDTRFHEPIRFEDVAAEVGLHPVYLSRAFRKHQGVVMGEYVRGLRLRHARHLLSATERSLSVISAEAGFSDASHLCRVFAEAHAVTPKAYRALVRERTRTG
ncbi:MAG TPA: helix-turn-helix domain-containing protein [Thermoanaerobaculia bacterium]|nr:helix-turn-helix domain-containing protein [Thermoanaerobaculia bacterium]